MNKIRGIVLCEGITDRVLLGNYIKTIKGWTFAKRNKPAIFYNEMIDWYEDDSNSFFGIWSVGGNSFDLAITDLMTVIKSGDEVPKVVVVTDHDDSETAYARSSSIYNSCNDILEISEYDVDYYVSQNNKWIDVAFADLYSRLRHMELCCLFVPKESEGALETFMLNCLSEHSIDKQEVIDQVKRFVAGLKSEVYLTKRRERTKAELSVSISIFSPDRMFDTLIELINLVDWTQFDSANSQFDVLKTL